MEIFVPHLLIIFLLGGDLVLNQTVVIDSKDGETSGEVGITPR
jgi:hypothetical protein